MSSAVCPAGSTRKKFTLRVLPPSGCVSLFSVSVMDTSLKPVLENGLYVPILAVVAPETPQVSAAAGADRASPQEPIGKRKKLERGGKNGKATRGERVCKYVSN